MTWVRAQWDRAAALVALAIGLVAFLLGWRGVSGTSFVAKQLPYVVSGALLGIFMVGVAAILWLSADLRDEWRELRGIRLLLNAQSTGSADHGPASQDHASAGVSAMHLLDGLTDHHTAEIPVLASSDMPRYDEPGSYGLTPGN